MLTGRDGFSTLTARSTDEGLKSQQVFKQYKTKLSQKKKLLEMHEKSFIEQVVIEGRSNAKRDIQKRQSGGSTLELDPHDEH
jgi:hypothetical protein